jgi:hypothetical protein
LLSVAAPRVRDVFFAFLRLRGGQRLAEEGIELGSSISKDRLLDARAHQQIIVETRLHGDRSRGHILSQDFAGGRSDRGAAHEPPIILTAHAIA